MDESILVIGAGMSGLGAARALADSGYRVTVLEGRDRIGGRTWTDHTLGIPLDMGASWIHGVRGNPLTEIANQNGIERSATDYDNHAAYYANGERISNARIEEVEALFDEVLELAAEIGEEQDNDSSLWGGIHQAMDQLGLDEEDRRDVLFAVNAYIEHEYAAPAKDLSLWWWDEGDGFGGGDAILPEGYEQIVKVVADGLDIRTGQVVQRISYGANGVTVQTNQGTFEADRCIVTLPVGVLKAGVVTFDPPLPAEKRAVIQRLTYGTLNKVYLRFPSVFWDANREVLDFVNPQYGRWAESFNYAYYSGEPILLMFNAGEFAVEVESWSDAQIIASAMESLRGTYGADIPDPEAFTITRWTQDPFSRGSYSGLGIGAEPDDRYTLAEPINDVLFFAGEATHRDYPSTVHGALLSGRRAADEVRQA